MPTPNNIPAWRITGDWWELCNCAIGCPCNFGSDPTLGYCEGVLTWLIRQGNYGDLPITKDLAVVLIIHWEGNVMEKNREFGFLIDDRANPAERAALEKIFTGYAGGAFEAGRGLTLRPDGAGGVRRSWRAIPQIHGAAFTMLLAPKSCPAFSRSARPSAISSPALSAADGIGRTDLPSTLRLTCVDRKASA